MKRYANSLSIGLSLLAMALLAACVPYPPGPPQRHDAAIGTITKIVGGGTVRINGRIVREGAVMQSGEHIETVSDARATLALARGGEVYFDADTDPVLEWLSDAFCKLRILINVGSILVDTQCQTEVETGSGAVVSTLGTMFHLTVNRQWTELTVLKGQVAIAGKTGERRIVAAGQQCRVLRGRDAPWPQPVEVQPVIDWACKLDKRLCRGGGQHRQSVVSVPNLVGMDLDEARRTLSRSDLRMGQVREKATDRNRDDGRVAAQSPEAGKRAAAGDPVDLQVWRHRAEVIEMPQVLNRPLAEAQRILAEKGIRVSRVEEIGTPHREQSGRVARQTPAPGTRIRPGMTAELMAYRYERPTPERPSNERPPHERLQPQAVSVPSLTGMHIEEAQAALERAGLRRGRTHEGPAPSRRQIGWVFRQRPEAGAKIDPGGAVDLWIYGVVGPPQPPLSPRPAM